MRHIGLHREEHLFLTSRRWQDDDDDVDVACVLYTHATMCPPRRSFNSRMWWLPALNMCALYTPVCIYRSISNVYFVYIYSYLTFMSQQ